MNQVIDPHEGHAYCAFPILLPLPKRIIRFIQYFLFNSSLMWHIQRGFLWFFTFGLMLFSFRWPSNLYNYVVLSSHYRWETNMLTPHKLLMRLFWSQKSIAPISTMEMYDRDFKRLPFIIQKLRILNGSIVHLFVLFVALMLTVGKRKKKLIRPIFKSHENQMVNCECSKCA